MEAVSVSGLKNNPSDAVRRAMRDVAAVMNRDKPDALLVGIDASGVPDQSGARRGLPSPARRR